MKRFRLIYDLPGGSLTLGPVSGEHVGSWEAQVGSEDDGQVNLAKVAIWDHKEQKDGHWLHRELRALIEIDGSDVFSASSEAAGRLHLLLTAAALHSGEPIGEIRLLLGLDITPGNSMTEFVQAHYLTSREYDVDVFRHKRALDGAGFHRALKLVSSEAADERLTRATIWHRVALSSDDPIDRFVNLWSGLENLNSRLRIVLGATPEYGTCKSCSEPYEIPSAAGIRALFTKYSPNGEADWKACRNFRVDVLHGRSSMANAITTAHACAELCGPLLRTGIFLCLGEDPGTLQTRPAPPSGRERFFLQLQGAYNLAPESLPRIPLLSVGTVRVSVMEQDSEREFSVCPELSSNHPVSEPCGVALHANGEFLRQEDVEVALVESEDGSRT